MGKLKNSIFNTLHTKRINMITTKDNHHITCSNDGSVKIWDSRNNQMISTFKSITQPMQNTRSSIVPSSPMISYWREATAVSQYGTFETTRR